MMVATCLPAKIMCTIPTCKITVGSPLSLLSNPTLSLPISSVSFKLRKTDDVVVLSHAAKLPTKLKAALTDIEPDLNEDPVDRWATNGIEPEDFKYGKYDGHHTYFEGDDKKGTFWETISEEYNSMDPPTGFQGLISWLFLPAVAAGMYFNVPGDYLFVGAGLFTIVFCAIEIRKPDKPHNFEPQIYNMERGARDKLISEYNTMDIWDFNEKYGDLWDFTLKKDDVLQR